MGAYIYSQYFQSTFKKEKAKVCRGLPSYMKGSENALLDALKGAP